MRTQGFAFGLAALLGAGTAQTQTFNNASLNGKYYFVHLQVTAAGGQATDARNLSGAMTFNGAGAYTYTGKLGVGPGVLAASTGQGTYTVSGSSGVTLANPIRGALQINARLSRDSGVVLGASTEATDNSNDIFIAFKAPTATVTNAVLNGAYTGATLQFPNGSSTAMKSAVVTLTPNGNGQFTRVTVVGHSADIAGGSGRNASQEATGSTYNISGDGSGSAAFGGAASLFSAGRELFVSQDGSYLLGYSTATGIRDIFIATKNFGAAATTAAMDGLYWLAELTVDGPSFSTASGGLNGASVIRRAYISERLHLDTRALDFSGINTFSVNPDSTGALGPLPVQGVNNMALGVSVSISGTARANTLVGAQIGTVNAVTTQYGIFFGVRAPEFTGTGVFLNPTGVVNSASFAPLPNPISPGGIFTILASSGLADSEATVTSFPLPTALGGASVAVNGQLVPIFAVPGPSRGVPLGSQINFQVPYGLTGNTARIQVKKGTTDSAEVTVPLAPTSPGIYSYAADAQSPIRGIITHVDGGLVTPQRPARPGDTVVMYVTGLGTLNPPVATGAANPSTLPLAQAVDPQIQILFGGVVATNVAFKGGAPGFAGLNQINVVIPVDVIGGNNVPVAISTSNAFTDLVDIAISF